MSPPVPGRSRREKLREGARRLRRRGYRLIAGADEAGAGPLAGPLVAAAVILPERVRLPGVDDSKRLRPAEREHWARRIREQALSWAVVELDAEEVDRLNPFGAALAAMAEAVGWLDPAPDLLLVDARRLPGVEMAQKAVIGGDGKHLVIAAASILAKVHRDGRMLELDREYPAYGFARHKGYGTEEHLERLGRHGPCPAHRRSFAPVRRLTDGQGRLFR